MQYFPGFQNLSIQFLALSLFDSKHMYMYICYSVLFVLSSQTQPQFKGVSLSWVLFHPNLLSPTRGRCRGATFHPECSRPTPSEHLDQRREHTGKASLWSLRQFSLSGLFSLRWTGWTGSNFRNPTVKCWANFHNPFERTNHAEFCMSPSLDRTLPESVIPQENNSPLTLFV